MYIKIAGILDMSVMWTLNDLDMIHKRGNIKLHLLLLKHLFFA